MVFRYDSELYDSELDMYYSYLEKTDHIPNKIIESFVSELATATADDFVTVFMEHIENVAIKYGNVLVARRTARDMINKLDPNV